MIPLIGRLYRENHVVTSVHGRSLVNQSVVSLLKAHRFARQVDEVELPLDETLPLLQALCTLGLGAASIDLARLSAAYKADGGARALDEFLREELADVVDRWGQGDSTSTDVVLYGFGRIGRLLARILIEHAGGGQGLRLRAIVVRKGSDDDIVKRASLLRRDSVHGPFEGTITVDEINNTILANGTLIQVIYSGDPASVDYTEYGINHAAITDDDAIVTAASCTTNAITPVLKAVNDKFGIIDGHVETVHSFTNDQNLIDNFHSGDRRGRSAALNMVITETGAAKAVAKALPELAGKLTGNAIRVPTPDVSMAILNLNLANGTTKDELNSYLRSMSLNSDLHKQIDFIDSPEVVSSDFLGSRRAGIVDGLATIADGNKVILYVWYDNEFGYSCQVIRVLEEMAGVLAPAFPSAMVEELEAVL